MINQSSLTDRFKLRILIKLNLFLIKQKKEKKNVLKDTTFSSSASQKSKRQLLRTIKLSQNQ